MGQTLLATKPLDTLTDVTRTKAELEALPDGAEVGVAEAAVFTGLRQSRVRQLAAIEIGGGKALLWNAHSGRIEVPTRRIPERCIRARQPDRDITVNAPIKYRIGELRRFRALPRASNRPYDPKSMRQRHIRAMAEEKGLDLQQLLAWLRDGDPAHMELHRELRRRIMRERNAA